MAQPRSYRSFASCHGGGNTWAVDRSGYNSRENKSSSFPAAKQWIFESSVRNDRVPFCARVQELKYWQPKVIPDDARTKICVNKESPRSGITWRQESRQHSIKEAVRFSWRKRFTKTTCIAIILTRFKVITLDNGDFCVTKRDKAFTVENKKGKFKCKDCASSVAPGGICSISLPWPKPKRT